MGAITPQAYALPAGGQVVAGAAAITANGTTGLDITQSTQRVVIDWHSFDTASDQTVRFQQPNANAIALNRVTNGMSTQFLGALSANGNVILMNPNGVIFGATARIDVNSLVATTANITNAHFMNDPMPVFDLPGNGDAAVINNGIITAKEAGLVGLVAPNVMNSGIITAKLGKVQLASGDRFTLDLYGDGLVQIAASDAVNSQLVVNKGLISAAGGSIALTAAQGRHLVDNLIVNTGVLEANSFARKNGTIILFGEGQNAVKNNLQADKHNARGSSTVVQAGLIDVSGLQTGEKGGTINVLADNVALMNGSITAAIGDAGGGTILIGGDYLGTGTTAAAANTFVSDDSYVLNRAMSTGDGGKTIVWSDGTTDFYGTIDGRGGNISGNGGFAETSGKINLAAYGAVNLTAANGHKGSYLLDPDTITILGNFAPTDINGLSLWLDASDASTLFSDNTGTTPATNGSTVWLWKDKSGNHNDATNLVGQTAMYLPTYVQNAPNGMPSLAFDGNQFLRTINNIGSAGNTARYLSVVFDQTNTSVKNIAGYGAESYGQGFDMVAFNNQLIGHFYGTGYDTISGSSPTYTTNAFTNGAIGYDGTSVYVYTQGLLGNAVAMNLDTTDSALRIGQGNYSTLNNFPGYISEVLFYNQNLSDASRGLIDQYQAAKWHTDLSAPGTGATEAAKAMSATGYNAFTTRYLERLSGSADIILQADHGITLDLKGDNLTLSAGRSLSMTTVNGDINAVSSGTITTATSAGTGGNVTINAGGTGGVDLSLISLLAGGAVNVTAGGGVDLGVVNGKTIAVTSGSGSDVTLHHALTAANGGNSLIVNSGGNFINNAGASALQPGTGRYLIYSNDPAQDVRGVTAGYGTRYSSSYASYGPGSVTEAGNLFLYRVANATPIVLGPAPTSPPSSSPPVPITAPAPAPSLPIQMILGTNQTVLTFGRQTIMSDDYKVISDQKSEVGSKAENVEPAAGGENKVTLAASCSYQITGFAHIPTTTVYCNQ